MFDGLRFEAIHQVLDFEIADCLAQRHETVGRPEVPVILRNFVLENQMIPKGVPSKLTDDPMILVQIAAAVGQNQIRREGLEPLELFLDAVSVMREKPIAKRMNNHFAFPCSFKKKIGAAKRFFFSNGGGAEHDPPDIAVLPLGQQPEYRSTTPNFNIVGMSSQEK